MKKIILSGCNGTMGRVISNLANEREDVKIIAGVDIKTDSFGDFPVFSCFADVNLPCDAIIDFSHPAQLGSLLNFAVKNKIPTVIGTTGISEEQREKIKEASKLIPIFFTGNMSIGINLMSELCKKASKVLGEQFDVEIIEKHHNKKIDAPSGTALMLGESVKEGLDYEANYVFDRHERREKRSKEEIGFHSVRGGTIVGEHEVIFAGNDEIVTLKHTALSKNIFANGAINASIFLSEQGAGLYDMKDMLK